MLWSALLRPTLVPLIATLAASAFAADIPSVGFDIRTYGAKGDGATLDTAAINKAIDAAHANGGGTVIVPAGMWLSGSIHLQSNITLYLGEGATILATSDAAAYDQ